MALTNGIEVNLLPNPVFLVQRVDAVPKLLERNGSITIGVCGFQFIYL